MKEDGTILCENELRFKLFKDVYTQQKFYAADCLGAH